MMRNLFQKRKPTNLSDVDIHRNEGVLFFIREYSALVQEDRTVAVYVSEQSANNALRAILNNKEVARGKHFRIEEFNFIEHKNSLVGK